MMCVHVCVLGGGGGVGGDTVIMNIEEKLKSNRFSDQFGCRPKGQAMLYLCSFSLSLQLLLHFEIQ